jgi:hypothetical protein
MRQARAAFRIYPLDSRPVLGQEGAVNAAPFALSGHGLIGSE